MSFTLDPTTPADSETPRNGASRIRSLTAEVLELFGETGAAAETYTLSPILAVDKTTGLATVQGSPVTALGIATKGYVDASTPSNVFVGSASGTNTVTATLAPVPASQAALAGFVIHIRIATTNTGAATFNPNGLGALAIVKHGNIPLVGGELVAGAWADLVYDTTNTNYQLLNPFSSLSTGVSVATDQSVTSSTALTNVTALVFAIQANEAWSVIAQTYFTMSSLGGLDIAWTVPSGATLFYGHTGSSSVATTSGSRVTLANSGGGALSLFFTQTINILNGSTPGNVQFQFSQNASDGTATTIKVPSSLVATRIN